MTERLYLLNSYQTTFDARVTESIRRGKQLSVALDRTCFYPTSGGQPHDLGALNGVSVVEVSIQEKDGKIIHTLTDEIWSDTVQGEIDWTRRFDHMQQHTGQHILSAVFLNSVQAETIGFHLGAESSTIDLNQGDLSPDQVEQAENMANGIIFANRQVRSTILTAEQAARLPLRKLPPASGPVRIVEVEKLDLSACGGTHVRQTGEIGALKITKVEKQSRGVRVEFLCGRRALTDYQIKSKLVSKIANDLTVGFWDIDKAVDRLQLETKSLRNELRKADDRLLEYKARELLRSAETNGKLRVVCQVFPNIDRKQLNILARNLTLESGVVALLGLAGQKSHILFARAENVDRDMLQLLKTALRVLGTTSGGGRPEMAQGGGPPADEKRVGQAIDRARRLLIAQR